MTLQHHHQEQMKGERLTRKEWVQKRQEIRGRKGLSSSSSSSSSSLGRRRRMLPMFGIVLVLAGFPVFWRSQLLPFRADITAYFHEDTIADTIVNTTTTAAAKEKKNIVDTSTTTKVMAVEKDDDHEDDEGEGAVLWLTSCENRQRAIPWFETAQIFQEKSDRAQTKVEIRVVNICEGAEWHGLMTKLVCMEKFLQNTFINATNEKDDGNGNTVNKEKKEKKKKPYVLFSDGDVLLNAWALHDATTVMQRYHDIVSPGGQSLVISAEPNCWFGKLCSENDFRLVYPNTTRTSCPAFVNSGLYMGEVQSILDMVQVTIGTQQNTQFDSILTSIGREGRAKPINDQTRVSVWYSINRDRAILDTEASLFRNMYFGMVNSSEHFGRNSCGIDGVASCGWFVPNIYGDVDTITLEIVMDPVPGCKTHPKPMFIHGNGGSKTLWKELMWKRQAARQALK